MPSSEMQALLDRIEALEDKVAFLLNHTPAPYTPHTPEERQTNEAAVVELLRKGKTADAMRLFRDMNDMPLSDLQNAIAVLKKKHGI